LGDDVKPVIGLNLDLHDGGTDAARVIEAVRGGGGLPVLLPPSPGRGDVAALIGLCDGFVLSSCLDVPAEDDGAKRGGFEQALARAAISEARPLLTIGGATQRLNQALGGKLYLDLFGSPDFPDPLRHDSPKKHMVHWVEIEPGSRLARTTRAPMLHTNSAHRRAIEKVGRGLQVAGRSSDGCVEAVEGTRDDAFLLGVQWHPERVTERGAHLGIFKALVQAARAGKSISDRAPRKSR
jgi:putative glutamine amidotransferase